jgi:esterase FrsA
MALRSLARRLLITACALTGATDAAAARLGTAFFLPALFVDRFTHMGGIDPQVFADQLASCRSFREDHWTGHWGAIADQHAQAADAALAALGGPSMRELSDPSRSVDTAALGQLLAPGAVFAADRGAMPPPDAAKRFVDQHPEASTAVRAVDELIKVITYKFAEAWPGWSPKRLAAYAVSQRLCETLTSALGPHADGAIEHVSIPVPGGDVVRATLAFPVGDGQLPIILCSNGLEGTVPEILLPALAYRNRGFGILCMEMPGTYSYRQPLAPAGAEVYSAVIDYLVEHPRVDRNRIGMLGVSFGGYWATRMAAADTRIRAAVANGAPSHLSFQAGRNIGTPEIFIDTLTKATHADKPRRLLAKLQALSLKKYYPQITTPLLVVNGENDTLLATQDSIDISTHAPGGLLKLYPDDDHCAMRHASDWFELSLQFLSAHLAATAVSV